MRAAETILTYPLNEGKEARRCNQMMDDCPYRPDSDGEFWWVCGWQIQDSRIITETILLENDTCEGDDFFLKYGWLPFHEDLIIREAVYNGRKVQLNKPLLGDVKKYKVFVNSGKKNKDGEVIAKKVNFGDPNMRVKTSPKARRNFSARHKCDTAKDPQTARYWSCRASRRKHGTFW